jgi:hypothetical protein
VIDSRCILRVTTPHFDSGHQFVQGEVDCSGYGSVHSQVQAGPQVYNTNGNWYNCCTPQPFPTQTMTAPTNTLTYDAVDTAVHGHTYHTWDFGYLYDNGANNTYQSSSVTY